MFFFLFDYLQNMFLYRFWVHYLEFKIVFVLKTLDVFDRCDDCGGIGNANDVH